MSKHTPGSWTFETESHTDESTWGIWSDDDSQEVVCQHVQNIDDARLIAAAPDLLAALESIASLDLCCATREEKLKADTIFAAARATIAKAGGAK